MGIYLGEGRLGVEAVGGLVVITSLESEYGRIETVRWQHRADRLGENLGSREKEKGEKDGYCDWCF